MRLLGGEQPQEDRRHASDASKEICAKHILGKPKVTIRFHEKEFK
jgi:hypothetical protein